MTTKTCQKPERGSKAILTTTTPSVHIRALGIKLHMKYIMGYEEDPRRAYAKHGAAWLDIGSRTLTNAWSKQLLSEKLSRQMGPPHSEFFKEHAHCFTVFTYLFNKCWLKLLGVK